MVSGILPIQIGILSGRAKLASKGKRTWQSVYLCRLLISVSWLSTIALSKQGQVGGTHALQTATHKLLYMGQTYFETIAYVAQALDI